MKKEVAIGLGCFAIILALPCFGGFVGYFAMRRAPLPSAPPEQRPQGETPEPEAGAPADFTKVLRLRASEGATPDELAKSVAILNRRFDRAKIPGRAELAPASKIVVRLRDQPDVLRRAGALLSAGGHLQFKEFQGPAVLTPERIVNETSRIADLKKAKTYDPAKETYDALPIEEPNTTGVVVNQGAVEGHYVASATPRQKDAKSWEIDFTVTPEGQPAFYEFTSRLKDRQFAVILDGVVKMVFWSRGQIREAGYMFRDPPFTEDEALQIAALMTSGKLPIDLSLEED